VLLFLLFTESFHAKSLSLCPQNKNGVYIYALSSSLSYLSISVYRTYQFYRMQKERYVAQNERATQHQRSHQLQTLFRGLERYASQSSSKSGNLPACFT